MRLIFSLILIGFFTTIGYTQSVSCKIIPEKFYRPKYPLTKELNQSFITATDPLKEKNPPIWIVMSDRHSNLAYTKSNIKSKVQTKLNFGDYCIVTEATPQWVKIAKFTRVNLKDKKIKKEKYVDLGWIQRENVLLWTEGLRDRTNIHAKCVILNNVANYTEKANFTVAPLYNSPTSEAPVGDVPLFNFYFIYKVNYSNGVINRVLIGTNSSTSPGALNNIIGWVDFDRLSKWNTRLCLEPNPENFAEREQTGNCIKGLKSLNGAKEFLERGTVRPKEIVWKDDPACNPQLKASLGEDKRFNGDVIRWPILEIDQTKRIYKSGIIASFGNQGKLENNQQDEGVRLIKESVSDNLERLNNYNVFFLLEGTSEDYKTYIKSVQQIVLRLKEELKDNNKLKFGAGIYRDVSEQKGSQMAFDLKELSTNSSSMISWLNEQTFRIVPGDEDEYTCLYYGLNRALSFAGFEENTATNIIITLGSNADLSQDDLRDNHWDKECLNLEQKIKSKFAKFDINWIITQVKRVEEFGEESFASSDFPYQIRAVMNDVGKEITQKNRDNGLNCSAFLLPSINEETRIIEPSGYILNTGLKRAGIGEAMQMREVADYAIDITKRIIDQAKTTKIDGEKILKGDIPKNNAGEFTNGALITLRNAIRKANKKNISAEEIKLKIAALQKESLYHQVYFPIKYKQSNLELFDKILFYPRSDLRDYLSDIKNILDDVANARSNPKQLREDLFYTLQSLAIEISGINNPKEIGEITLDEIDELMQGIKDEGYDLNKRFPIPLRDIRKKKEFSEKQLLAYIDKLDRVYSNLKNIFSNRNYKYMYKPDAENTYYWIPLHKIL